MTGVPARGSERDVDVVVDTARVAGTPLAVRGGGHDIAGHGTLEGGLVLDMSLLREVTVDSDQRSRGRAP